MKKIYSLLIALAIAATINLSANNITLGGVIHTIDTIEDYNVGPGTRYISMILTRPDNRVLHVFQSIVNGSNQHISFKTVVGNDSILKGERPSSMARRHSRKGSQLFTGSNGDFYITKGYVGLPTGATVSDNQLGYTPNNSRPVVAFDQEFNPMIGKFSFKGTVTTKSSALNIDHVNHLRGDNQLVLYNRLNGTQTRTNAYGTELTLTLCEDNSWGNNKTIKLVVDSKHSNQGGSSIPTNGAVLSGHGTMATALEALSKGDTLTLNLETKLNNKLTNITNCVGGDPRTPMLHDGEVETADIWNENHPRTGFGYSQTGDSVIFSVVDGRGTSIGCTTKVLAEIMKSAGAYNAINLDGGGSSSLYVAPYGPMNRCSDGTERSVSNGLFAVNNAPLDATFASLSATISSKSLPRHGYFTPKVVGYNQYGTLIETDVEGFTLSCDASIGHIENDTIFVASGTKNGFVTINKGTAQGKIFIRQITDAKIAIRLDSVLVNQHRHYPIEVQTEIGTKTENILPSAISWNIDDENICTITDGILVGKQNGRTIVRGTLGTFTDSIIVNVEITQNPIEYFEEWNAGYDTRWSVKGASKAWNSTLSNENNKGNIKFKYSEARAPYIQILNETEIYSLPDSITFDLNVNDVAVKEMLISIKTNDKKQSTIAKFDNIDKNKKEHICIVIDEIIDNAGDIAVFPLTFQYIKFQLEGSELNKGVDYTIDIDKIKLHYGAQTTDIEDIETEKTLSLYPNPTEGIIYIPENKNGKQYMLYNMQGQMVSSGTITNNSINISHIENGIWLLRIDGETNKIVKR